MQLSRIGREFYVQEIDTDPDVASWDASFDRGATWVAGEAHPTLANTWRWLVNGPGFDATGYTAATSTTISRSGHPLLRAVDDPEVPIRTGTQINLTGPNVSSSLVLPPLPTTQSLLDALDTRVDTLEAGGSGIGDMLGANNLSDVANVATARTNLGLGTAATHATGDYDASGAAAAAQAAAATDATTKADAAEADAIAAAATDATTKANVAQAAAVQRANHTGTQSADTITDGTTNKAYTATEQTKLAGVATGATANSADATLLARANHTGTQSADTLTDGTTNKAFLGTERTKLTGVATGATANDTDANLKARANHTGTQTASTISDFSTAADARITAATGVGVEAHDADLTTIAGLSPTNDDLLQRKAGAWTNRTPAQVKTDLALAKGDVGLGNVENAAPRGRLLGINTPTISPGVVNTTTETTMLSLTVPAAQVAAGDFLRFDAGWDFHNNSGSTLTYTIRIKLGATTVFSAVQSIGSAAPVLKAMLEGSLSLASLTDQRWTAEISGTAGTANAMDLIATTRSFTGVGTSTEDLSSDQTFAITAQMSVASASADARGYSLALTRTR